MRAFEGLLKAWFGLVKGHTELFFLELKLAKLSFVPLCISLAFLFVTFFSLWLLLLTLVVFFALKMGLSLIMSVVVSFGLNLFVTLICALFVYKYINNFRFRYTRSQLKKYQQGRLDHESA